MPFDIADYLQGLSFNSPTIHPISTLPPSPSPSSPKSLNPSPNPDRSIAMSDLRLIRRLGSGDTGSVYLASVRGGDGSVVAAKVMDKRELAGRRKSSRVTTEKEVLAMLDHPFLPKLYGWAEDDKASALLTEFCPGGDLHVLRQRQPGRRFDEHAVRFYAAEVVVALEYIHMLGIIYRDLKPENVLIRSDGHIMLTDFDLSFKGNAACSSAPQLLPHHQTTRLCIIPNCIVPKVSCFHPTRRRIKNMNRNAGLLFVTEPTDLRSLSFVGTHEYLAPEIVSGEGHGSAVDWWTLGVFIYELLYGATPFKGSDNELTLTNIVTRALVFPRETMASASTRDLITSLLVKDPTNRLGTSLGAMAIKQHSFFNGVDWALLRCAAPPHVPPPFSIGCDDLRDESFAGMLVEYY